jgi:serine/threonine protein kinase
LANKSIVLRNLGLRSVAVTGDGLVKIVDLSAARIAAAGGDQLLTTRFATSAMGDAPSAPELWLQGAAVTPKADVYALGVLVVELVLPVRCVDCRH